MKIDINGVKIASNLEQTLLDVMFFGQRTFKSQICNVQKKASKNLNVHTRIASYIDQTKRRIIMKSCNLQFGYCPLVWIMHNRAMNKILNRIHETEYMKHETEYMKHETEYMKQP